MLLRGIVSAASLSAESDDGVDGGGAAGGDEAGDERGGRQDDGDGEESGDVPRADAEEDGLHRKRLVTENFMIWGSMNFTRSGMQYNAEDVSLEVDVVRVSSAISEMEQLYGAVFE